MSSRRRSPSRTVRSGHLKWIFLAVADRWEAVADRWGAVADRWEAVADRWGAVADCWKRLLTAGERLLTAGEQLLTAGKQCHATEIWCSTRTLTREGGGRTHVVERAVDPLAALTVDEQATEQDLALTASLENRGRGNPRPYPWSHFSYWITSEWLIYHVSSATLALSYIWCNA